MKNKPIEYVGYFDGSCNPNPKGELGVGAVIYYENKHKDNIEIWTYSKMYPPSKTNTNNVAEYMGLIALLDYFIDNGLTNESIIIRGDSKMAVNQMKGNYKINKGLYRMKGLEAKEKVGLFTNLRIYWCPREGNKRADYLSNPSQKEFYEKK